MKALTHKTWRDVKQMKLRGVAVVLAIAFWVGGYSAYYMSLDSFRHSYAKISEELNLADLQVFIQPSTEEELPVFEDIPGIKAIQKRLFSKGSVELKSGKNLSVFIVYDEFRGTSINTLRILQGKNLTEENISSGSLSVLIDRTMHSFHDFQVGDRLNLTAKGQEIKVEVQGVVLSPEFIFPTGDPNLIVLAKGSLGILFASMEPIRNFFGYPLYNSLSFVFDKNYAVEELEEKVKERLSGIRVESFIPRRDSLDYQNLSYSVENGRKFAPIALSIMGMVISILIFINLYRMMEEKKTETGVLYALGIRRRILLRHNLTIVLFYLLLGSFVGACLSIPLNHVFTKNILNQVDVPIYHLYPLRFIMEGIFIGVIFCLLSCFLAFFITQRSTPMAAIKGKGPTVKALPVWAAFRNLKSDKLYFLLYALRGLLRRPNLAFFSILSIGLALALTVSFNILTSSIHQTMIHFFERDPWNLAVDFTQPVSQMRIEEEMPPDITVSYEGYLKGFGVIEVSGKKSFAQVIGYQEGSRMRKQAVVEGADFSGASAFEIILNRNLWPSLRIGQQITIETTQGAYPLTLVGIVEEVNIASKYAYLPLGTAQKILGEEGKYSGIWVVTGENTEAAKKNLYRNERVANVTLKKDITAIVDQHIKSINAGIRSMLLLVMILAPIFLFTSVGLNIHERERDFIIFRSMGFEVKKVWRILLAEVMIIGSLGTLISIPLAILLGLLQNRLGSAIFFNITTYIRPQDYSYAITCYVLFPLVAWIFTRRIMGMNLVEKLGRTIG
ncbi:MAG: ABC transporter permease [Deltaproteobacteria bacterium]|nr:ABC transporter permease [Deltaproteobacteria bacterium]